MAANSWQSVKHYLYRGKHLGQSQNNGTTDLPRTENRINQNVSSNHHHQQQQQQQNNWMLNERINDGNNQKPPKSELYKLYKIERNNREPFGRKRCLCYILSALCKLGCLAGIIVGAIALYLYLKPAGYLEFCENKSCISNLKCANKTCSCDTNLEYYNGECARKRLYGEDCTHVSCDLATYGLVCTNGYCACDSSKKWDGTNCTRGSYNDPCTATSDCYSGLSLFCISGKCVCNSTSFWDGTMCINRFPYNHVCSFTYECMSGCSCLNGLCSCSSSQYYSTSLTSCQNYKTYTNSCSSNNECLPNTNLICNTWNNNCACPSVLSSNRCDCVKNSTVEYYWDGQSCVLRKPYSQSCGLDYECISSENTNCISGQCLCRSSEYFDGTQCQTLRTINQQCPLGIECISALVCQSGQCQCDSLNPIWSNSLQKCISYLNYSQPCTSSSQCNPSLNLYCNSGSNCNCPLNLTSNTCDCSRQSSTDYFWNGSSCVRAYSYGSPCNYDYECQTNNQRTICYNGTCLCDVNKVYRSGKCYSCPNSNWLIYNNSCYFLTTTSDKSDRTLDSNNIERYCFTNTGLAKLNSDGLINFLLGYMVPPNGYWVEASNFYNSNYGSITGSWTVDSSKWCINPGTKTCVYFDSQNKCFSTDDCSNDHYMVCQYY